MVERYVDRVYTEQAVLDIGGDIGALVIYTGKEYRGREIQLSQKGNRAAPLVHTAVWERQFNGQTAYAGVYPELPEGEYIIWTHPSREVTIVGGCVSEADLRDISDIYVPPTGHAHYEQDWDAIRELLPPRYQNKQASAAPMGSATMRYQEDGQVAWDELWTDFCDLALAGGAPHRGTLLEPVDSQEIKAASEEYRQVVAEIRRGFELVTGLATVHAEKLGWIGLQCEDEEMALWMLRAIIVENVSVRREGDVLYLPAGPHFQIEQEIKNVITVVAKTYHYWTEHRAAALASVA